MFVDGYWAGWSEFRYGAKLSPKTAKAKLARVLARQERKHVTDEIFNIMNDWRASPFENQGRCVAGLRVAFCLQGSQWHAADHEARIIVDEALRQMGARRPTWEEGQLYYGAPTDTCKRCLKPLDAEDFAGGRRGKFCSSHCAKAFLIDQESRHRHKDAKVVTAAYRVIIKDKTASRICKTCGTTFHARSHTESGTRLYCSRKCAAVGKRRPVPLRPCKHCGAMFRPPDSGHKGIFCSTPCKYAGMFDKQFKLTCQFCSETFFSVKETTPYCGKAHAETARKRRIRAAERAARAA